jgi:hypothetical protein
VTSANPGYTEDELYHQLAVRVDIQSVIGAMTSNISQVTKTKLLFVHLECLKTVLAATRNCGISADRIILFMEANSSSRRGDFLNIDTVVQGKDIQYVYKLDANNHILKCRGLTFTTQF